MKNMNVYLQVLLGFILADIISGFFHWFEDTYLDYCIKLPILSEVSKDNELHHYFPRSIIAYSYLEHFSYSLPLAICIMLILYLFNRSIFLHYPYLMISFFLFSVSANIFHRFSHMRECENNFIICALQKTGVLCSHSHHSLHHKLSNIRYCVISEYNNFILDFIQFWRILEYIVYLITNIKPNQKPGYNDYFLIHNHMHENAKLECPDTPSRIDVDELIKKLQSYKKCKVGAN